MPVLLEFDGDCLIVLRKSLLAMTPQEGCALLLGDESKSIASSEDIHWRVQLIWPCCNIWKPGLFSVNEISPEEPDKNHGVLSKNNRFAIDPREQLHAQRWARSRKMKIIGNAHSHPAGSARPSSLDIKFAFGSGLMVIMNKTGLLRAWLRKERKTKNADLVEIGHF